MARALAKAPAGRYPNCLALATALQTGGTVERFVGSYLVQHGAITVFNVRPAG